MTSSSPLNSAFFKELERLAFVVAGTYEALKVFEAVEIRVDKLNVARKGRAFGYIQQLAIDRMLICIGKATSKRNDDVSFRSLAKEIGRKRCVNVGVIRRHLTSERRSCEGRKDSECVDIFVKRLSEFKEAPFNRLKMARDKLIAHADRTANWNDIGATFPDVEMFIAVASSRIDSCFRAYIDGVSAGASLYAICRQHAEKNIRAQIELVELALQTVAEQ